MIIPAATNVLQHCFQQGTQIQTKSRIQRLPTLVSRTCGSTLGALPSRPPQSHLPLPVACVEERCSREEEGGAALESEGGSALARTRARLQLRVDASTYLALPILIQWDFLFKIETDRRSCRKIFRTNLNENLQWSTSEELQQGFIVRNQLQDNNRTNGTKPQMLRPTPFVSLTLLT